MKKFKPLMTISALSLITLLSASTAFATTPNTFKTTSTQVLQNQGIDDHGGFTSVLDTLVSAGTITQAQETAVQSALKPSGAPNGDNVFTTALDSLVTAGTITQDQETSIQSALKEAVPFQGDHNGFTTVLDNLVSAGTITQAQEDVVQSALKPSGAPDGGSGFTTALESLVTAGTITQDQETAILSALKDSAPSCAPDGGPRNGDFQAKR